MKKLLLLLVCMLSICVNAQTYTMQYTDYKVFDSIKERTSFEIKKKTNVMIDYGVNIIVISTDSVQKFLSITSNFKADEDIFFDCKDKNDKLYKLSMLTTPTHYILIEALGSNITTYRVSRN